MTLFIIQSNCLAIVFSATHFQLIYTCHPSRCTNNKIKSNQTLILTYAHLYQTKKRQKSLTWFLSTQIYFKWPFWHTLCIGLIFGFFFLFLIFICIKWIAFSIHFIVICLANSLTKWIHAINMCHDSTMTQLKPRKLSNKILGGSIKKKTTFAYYYRL